MGVGRKVEPTHVFFEYVRKIYARDFDVKLYVIMVSS